MRTASAAGMPRCSSASSWGCATGSFGRGNLMLPDLFRLIGSDRCLTPEEVERATGPHSATRSAWEVYAAAFQGFTGATLDPDFNRLIHPAAQMGRVRLEPD